MRLLNVHTMQLEEILDVEDASGYAILSHTWGRDEVSFQNLHDEETKFTSGYRKIECFCRQAIQDGFNHAWIDTCCIDKKDPTELSEAINLMFRWYQESSVCYVYLADVEADERGYVGSSVLGNSRWWTRGWTLQELLAPKRVIFFDRNWNAFGTFRCYDMALHLPDIIEMLPSITHINKEILYYRDQMKDTTAAEKLSWASRRQTTRKEDMAYCLLGILDVNMPLLYGEGNRAFIRLQEEYIKQHNDPSLLIWGFGIPCTDAFQARMAEFPLAPSPSLFAGFNSLTRRFEKNKVPFAFTRTNNGIEVELLLLTLEDNVQLALFGLDHDFYSCYRKTPKLSLLRRLSTWQPANDARSRVRKPIIAVPLKYCQAESRVGFDVYERILLWPPFLIPEDSCMKAEWKRACLKAASSQMRSSASEIRFNLLFPIDIQVLLDNGFGLKSVYPPRDTTVGNGLILYVLHGTQYKKRLFIFEGPNNLPLGFLINDRSQYKLAAGALIGEISISDMKYHLLPQGSILFKRISIAGWLAAVRSRLYGVSSIEISGEQLGRPGIRHLKIALRTRGQKSGRSLTVQFDVIPVNPESKEQTQHISL
ncbi:HET-domain-containing protein [Daldinia loculata]|nr:HET-domain-containing protein [Daldinia loculata]